MTPLTRKAAMAAALVHRAPRRSSIGIVHFGPGAFHRAHQAAYVDALLDTDPRWGIAAVSLRSRDTVDMLAAQDGLYTLAVRDSLPGYRLIDAHRQFYGPGDEAAIQTLLADPGVGLVTTTVTEKGYCLLPDGRLDIGHPDIVHDLGGGPPLSVVGWIVAGLGARRAAGLPPYVVMPCDNLADNGSKLRMALIAFAGALDPALAAWIAREVRVPATMVDSITPASDAALRADVARATGLHDAAPVQREAFTQWVVEDVGDIGPDLASVGVTVTHDVSAYERAKLRILNGAHSTLAYLGLLRGHETVAQAMGDGPLAGFVEAMIAEEIVPTIGTVPGLDLARYAADVLTRFRNPAIVHRLEQIAQDGSQKLPYRLGDTLVAHRARGSMPQRIVVALAGWIAFVLERCAAARPIVDPAAAVLTASAQGADPHLFARRLADRGCGIPAALCDDMALLEAIGRAAEDVRARKWPVIGL